MYPIEAKTAVWNSWLFYTSWQSSFRFWDWWVSQFSPVELLSIRVVCSKCFAPSLLLRRYFPLVITKYEKCLQHFPGSSHPHQHSQRGNAQHPEHTESNETRPTKRLLLAAHLSDGEKGLHRFCTHAKLRASGSLLQNGREKCTHSKQNFRNICDSSLFLFYNQFLNNWTLLYLFKNYNLSYVNSLDNIMLSLLSNIYI